MFLYEHSSSNEHIIRADYPSITNISTREVAEGAITSVCSVVLCVYTNA